jgi:hypothetical protein
MTDQRNKMTRIPFSFLSFPISYFFFFHISSSSTLDLLPSAPPPRHTPAALTAVSAPCPSGRARLGEVAAPAAQHCGGALSLVRPLLLPWPLSGWGQIWDPHTGSICVRWSCEKLLFLASFVAILMWEHNLRSFMSETIFSKDPFEKKTAHNHL